MVARGCTHEKLDGKLCKAAPMRDVAYCFFHNPVESWSNERSEEDAATQSAFWRQWRGAVAGLLATSLIEQDAREELERRYLGGRPALLPDSEKEWGRFADLVDGLWGIAEAHADTCAEEEEQDETVGGPLYDKRVAERVKWLADDARVATLERLGENLRAATIMERRLTTGA